VHADDAVGVALQRRDTFARVPVPDFDGVYREVSKPSTTGACGELTVQASADQLGIIELQGTNSP
jgi:hypothetical protein